MNVNLHIDSIVLDGIELRPGESQVLQEVVTSTLTVMINERMKGALPSTDPNIHDNYELNAISTGHRTDTKSLGSNLASAIYGNIPQAHFDSVGNIKGQR